jgi:hypothetical protein
MWICIGMLPWDTRLGAWSSHRTSRSFTAPQLAGLRSGSSERERGNLSEAMIEIEITVYRCRAQALSGLAPLGILRSVGNWSRRGLLGSRQARGERGMMCGPRRERVRCGLLRQPDIAGRRFSFASLRNPPEPRAQVGQHTSEALRSSGKALLNRRRTER